MFKINLIIKEFNVVTIKFKIAYVTHIVFLLDSVAIDQH